MKNDKSSINMLQAEFGIGLDELMDKFEDKLSVLQMTGVIQLKLHELNQLVLDEISRLREEQILNS